MSSRIVELWRGGFDIPAQAGNARMGKNHELGSFDLVIGDGT